MSEHATAYEVLRVQRGSGARAIRAAYLRRARATHPDRGGAGGEFARVRAAYDALCAAAREQGRGQGRGQGVGLGRCVVAEELRVGEMERTSGGWLHACRCGEGYVVAREDVCASASGSGEEGVVVACSGCSLAVRVFGAE